MMGRAHTLSGAAVWAVSAPAIATTTGLFTLTPLTWVAGSLLCAGAALAPDLDHPGNSSASNSIKPITGWLSQLVHLVSFGHRKGTHSFVGIAIATLITLLVARTGTIGAFIMAFFLAAFTAKALGVGRLFPKGLFRTLSISTLSLIAAAATIAVADGNYGFLIAAVAIGTFVHVVGDCITVAGVPWLFPLTSRSFRIATLSAGGPTERYILTPLFILVFVWGIYMGWSSGFIFGYPITYTL